MNSRKRTRRIHVGSVPIGGGAPIAVQSMTNTDTRDIEATVKQIRRLEEVGCEIVRVAVPDMETARVLSEIRNAIHIPLIADIHYDHRLALEAIRQGVDGLRINPGNIGGKRRVKELVSALKDKGIPIRIGVNSGSLEKEILRREGRVTPRGMVESVMKHISILEDMDYHEIKVSLKSSDVLTTIEAYRLISEMVDYPLHLGITEAGTTFSGLVKSSVGLGILLYEGIGDTLRVSLTGDPEDEIRAAYSILRTLGLRSRGIELISCPTCGRCRVDLIPVAQDLERRLAHIVYPLKVAVMGCSVNGPGEAKEADIGICAGREGWILFRKGEVLGRLRSEDVVEAFAKEVEDIAREALETTPIHQTDR